jgi:glycolate oxidase FAD binding subunit
MAASIHDIPAEGKIKPAGTTRSRTSDPHAVYNSPATLDNRQCGRWLGESKNAGCVVARSGEFLPLIETAVPESQPELAEVVRRAHDAGTPIYPLGGQTCLNFGLPAKAPGIGLSLAKLNRVIDYPARDMTITVEAGIGMKLLAETLAAERQRLPIDAPQADRATLGGVIATNTSGPRRCGCGTIRDYVIGIEAVDGRGVTFHGGGRVVKNVAGYDFCKLLCGSLGTLGILTQVTLKLKPLPAASALITCVPENFEHAERLLAALVVSQTTPTAIELVCGPQWSDDPALPPLPGSLSSQSIQRDAQGRAVPATPLRLIVGLEGTAPEVDWMTSQLKREWGEQGVTRPHVVAADAAAGLWQRLTEFPATGGTVLKMNVVPSATVRMMQLAVSLDPQASLQAHAGSGIVLARTTLAGSDLSHALIQRLQPAALAAQGSVVLLAAGEGVETIRRVVWGNAPADLAVMQAVKQQFDPRGLLNPGRFVYAT